MKKTWTAIDPAKPKRVAKPKPPLESKITAAIVKYLKGAGAQVWHFKVAGGAYQQRGVPDLVCCIGGRFVSMEVKRPEVGHLTDLQAHTIERIRDAGGVAEVVTSVAEARALVEGVLQFDASPLGHFIMREMDEWPPNIDKERPM